MGLLYLRFTLYVQCSCVLVGLFPSCWHRWLKLTRWPEAGGVPARDDDGRPVQILSAGWQGRGTTQLNNGGTFTLVGEMPAMLPLAYGQPPWCWMLTDL
jgi:hypothetical protein